MNVDNGYLCGFIVDTMKLKGIKIYYQLESPNRELIKLLQIFVKHN